MKKLVKLVQASTLNALMLGNFDTTISVRDFLSEADTGIGTYTGLDGEAIFENGVAYKATADGGVSIMKPEDGVAFGTVARFDSMLPEHEAKSFENIEELKELLKPYTDENPNIFYMLVMSGSFDLMHVRSCYVCEKPYPTLSEAASHQKEFKYENVKGKVIAVYCPPYVEGMNLPGWHFHFLSEDKTKGGHILGLSGKGLKYRIEPISEWEVILPENAEFAKLDLCEDLSAKTAAVEGNAKRS